MNDSGDAWVRCVQICGLTMIVLAVAGTALTAEDVVVNATGGNDRIVMRVSQDDASNVEVLLNGVVVFADDSANLKSLTINGLDGDDVLVVDYNNGFIAVPTTFNGGGHITPTGDSLEIEGPIPGAGTTAYTPGPTSPEGKSGTITNLTGASVHVVHFSGLEPITITGPINTLTVIAGASGGSTMTLSDDPADNAGAGGNVLTSNGTMETLYFSGVLDFVLYSGSGSQAITVTGVDPAMSGSGVTLASVTVDGRNDAASTDTSPDTFYLQTLPAAVTASLRGDAGNDIFHIGSAANVLGGVLGTVYVNGGDHLTPLPSSRMVVTANGLTIDVSLPYGDDLWYHDEGHTAAARYDLYPTTLSRDSTVAPTNYSNIEIVRLRSGTAANDINVANTALATTFVDGNAGADDIDIYGTAAGSLVGVFALGGDDTVDVRSVGDGGIVTVVGGDGGDVLTLANSGIGSGVKINGEDRRDTITIDNTGAGSATYVTGDGGDDEIRLRASAATSEIELHGGDNNDRFELHSTSNQLDGILGNVTADGGARTPSPGGLIPSVTANGLTVSMVIPQGDRITVNDDGTTAAAQYNLDADSFNRDTTVAVTTFTNFNTFSLRAGHGNNDINIANTAPMYIPVHSWEGADDIDVTTTVTGSMLAIQPTSGIDTVDIADMGDGSMLSVFGGDNVQVMTTGTDCGLRINGSDTVGDNITIRDLGAGSALLSTVYAGNDTYTIERSAATSEIELHGDENNDVFAVGAPGLDGLLGGFSADGGTGSDSLTFDDSTDSSNNSYDVFDTSLVRSGSASLTYGAVETLSLLCGSGQDDVVVDLDNPPSAVSTFFLDAGDEAGTDGDDVTAFGSAAIDMTLLGGDPTTAPGDSLVYSAPISYFAEFETLQASGLVVAPTNVSFQGLVPGSPMSCQTIEITNEGTIPYNWSAVGCDTSPFSLVPAAPGGSIDPGVTDDFDVCLDPSMITEPTVVSCIIDFTSDDPDLTDLEIPVFANLGLSIPALGRVGLPLFVLLIAFAGLAALRRW